MNSIAAEGSVDLRPKATKDEIKLPARRQLRSRLYLLLGILDLAALVVCLAIASFIRIGAPFGAGAVMLGSVLLPSYTLLAINSRAYGPHVLLDWRKGAVAALRSILFSVGAILFISFGLRSSSSISRILLGSTLAIAFVLLPICRFQFGRLVRRMVGGVPLTHVLLFDGVSATAPAGTHAIDAAALGLRPSLDDPMMRDRLGRHLGKADSVVIACLPERRHAWAMALKGLDIEGQILMPELSVLGGVGMARFGAESTIVVAQGALDLRARLLKRGLDLSLATVALLILAPFTLLLAVAIRLESKGPVLFVQPRMGRGNRLFAVYKFRSMRIEQCDSNGARSASRDDHRITRVGRLIRSTSIDELPQLLNILKGDMSFVGPRPHALGSLAGDQLFWEVDPRYWHRHAAKPGLTGLAQVRGFRGATLKRSDLLNRLQADLEYQSGWTLWRDISIMFATLRVVVHKNAF